MGINEVGVDKVAIDEMGINHVSYFLENVGQIQLDQLPRPTPMDTLFFIDIVPIWNSLPTDIIRSLSPRSFKTKILALYF